MIKDGDRLDGRETSMNSEISKSKQTTSTRQLQEAPK